MFKRVRKLIILGALGFWSAVGACLWFDPDRVPTFADDYLVDKWERELADSDRSRAVGRVTCEVKSVFSGRSFMGETVFGRRYNIGVVGIAVPNNLVPEAKRRLQELVQNQHVRIEIHTIVPDGGVVGSVFLEGRDIGAQLVSEGLAVTTPQMRAKSPSHRSEVLVAAQKKALSESAGFWGNAGER